MPIEDEKQLWRHPHGMDVLKRLGIVDHSNASVSETDDDQDKSMEFRKSRILKGRKKMENGENVINDESDDNEYVFDRASLLHQHQATSDDDHITSTFINRRTDSMAESRRLVCSRGFLVAVAFFIMGSCYSIIGPTLGNLQFSPRTDSMNSITSVVSANAFGAMIGIILSTGCNTLLNPFCVIMFALPLCTVTTLVVPWCTTLTSAMMIFMMQGVSFGLIERGCYSVFQAYWRRRHSVLILFYIFMSAGATISPLMISSFFSLNLQSQNSSIVDSNEPEPTSPFLHREYRNGILSDQSNETGITCGETVSGNCTTENSTLAIVKKPPMIDATNLDPTKSQTEKKEEELAKQAAEESKTVAPDGGLKSGTVNGTGVIENGNKTGLKEEIQETTSTSTLPTTQTSAPIVPEDDTSPITRISSGFGEETLEKMKKELARLNNLQLAYVPVACVSAVLTALYALVCCFTFCNRNNSSTTANTSPVDYRLNLDTLWKSRTNCYAAISTGIMVFLLVGLESIISSLLTLYGVMTSPSLMYPSIIAISTFWLSISVSRILSSCFYTRLSQPLPMACCLGLALLSTAVVVITEQWPMVWLISTILGGCSGILYPLLYCWFDQQLSPGPWFSTVWCLTGEISRFITPYCTSWAMVHHSNKDFLFALLIIALMACTSFVLMRWMVREAVQSINTDQQQQKQRVMCKVRFAGDDALFEYEHFTNEEGEDEVTCFDRSRDTKSINGGTAPLFELNPKRFDYP